eukprot:950646-Alexandrium_andersonii.AAC.1
MDQHRGVLKGTELGSGRRAVHVTDGRPGGMPPLPVGASNAPCGRGCRRANLRGTAIGGEPQR